MALLCSAAHEDDYNQMPWRWGTGWKEGFCRKTSLSVPDTGEQKRRVLRVGQLSLANWKSQKTPALSVTFRTFSISFL